MTTGGIAHRQLEARRRRDAPSPPRSKRALERRRGDAVGQLEIDVVDEADLLPAAAPPRVEGTARDRDAAHALGLDADRLRTACTQQRLRLIHGELERERADAL